MSKFQRRNEAPETVKDKSVRSKFFQKQGKASLKTYQSAEKLIFQFFT